MSRVFWIALGATAGVLVVRRATRAAQALTPAGAAEHAAGALHTLAHAVGSFGAEVRVAAQDREDQLRRALGLAEDPSGEHPTTDTRRHDTREPYRP